MAVSGSGGYGGPNFSQIESSLRNIAVQFASILSVTQQLRASVETFRNFERELTLANFAAGGTAETFNQMNMAARNMALGSVNSVAQLANAFGNLARAGLDAKEVLMAATGVMLLANATLSDLGEAADITASTMAQFNLQASESNRIANLFVASSNTSLSSMNKLAFAMRQVGPIAAQANFSLEQTVGMLDKLFDAGLRGEQAGTALRNVIARLVDPMGEGKSVLDNLGVSAIDSLGNTDVDGALRKLAELNLSLQDVSNLFGVEAASGALTLLAAIKDTNDGLDQHIARISGTNEAYGQALATMATLDGSLRQAANAFAELQLIAGEAMAPVIIELSQGFVDLVLNLREMDGALIQTIMQFALAGVGVGVLLKGIASIGPAFKAGTKAMEALTDATTAARNASAAFGAGLPITGMNAASNSVRSLGASMLGFVGIAGGILGVAAAIGAVTFAILEMQKAKRAAKIEELLGPTELNADQGRRELRNTRLQMNVDQETGSGSIEYFGALEEQRKGAETELAKGRAMLDDLRGQQRSNYAEIRKQADELRDFSNLINTQLLKEANGGSQEVTAAATALGNATAANWTSAVEAFRIAYEKSVLDSDRPQEIKDRLIRESKEKFANLASVDAQLRTDIQGELRAFANNPSDKFDIEQTLTGQTAVSTLARIFAVQKDKYVLDGRELEQRDAELRGEIATIEANIATATSAQAALIEPMRKQISLFSKAAYGSATEAGEATAAAINQWVEKNPERFAAIIRQAGSDTVQSINLMKAAMQAEGIRIQGALDNMIPANIPGINRAAIDAYVSKSYSESISAAGDQASAAMRQAGRVALRATNLNAQRDEAREVMTSFLGQNQTAITNGLIEGMSQGNVTSGQQALAIAGPAVRAGFEQEFVQVVDAALRLQNAAVTGAANAYKPSARSGGRGGGARIAQRAMEKILDLPTEAEFQLDNDRIRNSIQNMLANTLSFGIDDARRAMADAELDYREDLLDMQRDFEKFWRDNIAKGLPSAVDEAAVNALAGRGFEMDGTTYSAELLKSSETAGEYLANLLLFLTPKIPANAPQYQERIDALTRVVTRLGDQNVGLNLEARRQIEAINIERQRTEEAIQRSFTDFDLATNLATLQSEFDRISLMDPVNVDLRARVGFQLELADLRSDQGSQINELQDQFREQFENIGVNVNIVGDAFEVASEQGTELNINQIEQTDDLIIRYERLRDSIYTLTEARERDAAAALVSLEAQRARLNDYIDAIEKVANANGNNSDVMADFMSGLDAGFASLMAEAPSSFTVGMDAMKSAVLGFTDITSAALTGMGSDWRQSTANVLQSISQMIAKMLIMAATLNLIRMIPGGSALLSAMDIGSAVGGAASAGLSAGSAYAGAQTVAGGGLQPGRLDGGGAQAPSTSMFSGLAASLNGNVAKTADRVSGVGLEALSTYGAQRVSNTSSVGDTYITAQVNVQGNATASDAERISEEQVKVLGSLLVQSQAERDRQNARNRTSKAGTF